MTISAAEDIRALLKQSADEVNLALDARLADLDPCPPTLAEAMRYSLHAGGKRLRPILVLWCCEACGGDRDQAMPSALAIECVHTFSLIHDDLPALDNDDFRRGRPANHRKFGEALAILAGDALLALAFEILSEDVSDQALSVAMMRELSTASGGSGMIGGEVLDLAGQSSEPNVDEVARIHAAKTARLIQGACRLSGTAARAETSRFNALSEYGHALGLAFQVVDDLLDVTGNMEDTGKQTGKDADAGKQTYPRAVGVEESRRIADDMFERAIAALAPLGSAASRLTTLARYVVERNS